MSFTRRCVPAVCSCRGPSSIRCTARWGTRRPVVCILTRHCSGSSSAPRRRPRMFVLCVGVLLLPRIHRCSCVSVWSVHDRPTTVIPNRSTYDMIKNTEYTTPPGSSPAAAASAAATTAAAAPDEHDVTVHKALEKIRDVVQVRSKYLRKTFRALDTNHDGTLLLGLRKCMRVVFCFCMVGRYGRDAAMSDRIGVYVLNRCAVPRGAAARTAVDGCEPGARRIRAPHQRV